MTFLSGSLAIQVFASPTPNLGRHSSDNVCVQIAFCNGSVGVITYASTGDKAFSKERLEVFGGGKAAVLNDFRVLELSGHARRQKVRHLFRADKGHRAEWQATIRAILEGKPSPIPFLELVCATRTTFRIIDSLNSGQPEKLEYSDLEHG
jgi:polar amino acid transport system substrate-binding protein